MENIGKKCGHDALPSSLQTGYTNIPFTYEIANGLIDELQGGVFISIEPHLNIDLKTYK